MKGTFHVLGKCMNSFCFLRNMSGCAESTVADFAMRGRSTSSAESQRTPIVTALLEFSMIWPKTREAANAGCIPSGNQNLAVGKQRGSVAETGRCHVARCQ